MLNGKYIIIGGEYSPVVNRYASGNAWFVDSFVPAETPDEEIALLASTDLKHEAVLGKDFHWALDQESDLRNVEAYADTIAMTCYAPNELRYTYKVGADRPVIFSEIYYPDGWKAWIEPAGTYGEVRDGHYQPTEKALPLELFRADWILRGAIVPAGEGNIVMRFEPESYQVGEDISRACSITLITLLVLAIGGIFYSRRRES
jgi:hypothetical protein